MSSTILDRKFDRLTADLVNDVTSLAKKHGRAGMLREVISQRVSKYRLDCSAIETKEKEKTVIIPVLRQLIVAHDLDGAIGNLNSLPWEQGTDMRYFKKATVGTAIIMGSKTFASMGRSLPERFNIVVTSKAPEVKNSSSRNLAYVPNLETAVNLAVVRARELRPENPIVSFVGGANVYRQAMESNLVDFVRDTTIETSGNVADAYYNPRSQMSEREWELIGNKRIYDSNDDQFAQEFKLYVKKNRFSEDMYARLRLSENSYF